MAEQLDVLNRFSRAVLDRHFQEARACLAPWLEETMDESALEEAVNRSLTLAAEQCGIEEPVWPTDYSLDRNEIDLEELRSGMPQLSSHVNASNYTGWHCLQFDPETDDNAPFDIWVATVTTDDGSIRLGHLEFSCAD
jgi:hypothetical protein